MASDKSERDEVTLVLPEEVRDWLDEQAAGTDAAREDVAKRLLDAYHSVAVGSGGDDGAPLPACEGDRSVTDDQLDDRIGELNDEFRTLLADVRKRVVQVKRETDQKAVEGHDHPEFDERLGRLERQLDNVDESIETVETQLEAGFENYEDVLKYLTDETESLRERTDALARALIDVREEVELIAVERARRDEVNDLKRAANQYGIRTAECDACSASVDVAMLAEPECPHCTATVTDVSPGTRFLNTDTLVTGATAALTDGTSDGADDSLESIVEDDRDAPEGLEWARIGDGGNP